ncbi:Ig-like domain-containing protein [Arthrobacter psychrolactophilus]
MAEFGETKKTRKGWKIALISLVTLGIVGGIGVITAPSWMPDGLLPTSSQTKSTSPQTTTPATPEPTAAAIPAKIALTPATGTEFVNPVGEITAVISNGTVSHAVLKESETGAVLDGELSVGKDSWKPTTPLKFNTAYTFDVTAVDTEGFKSNQVSTFTTVPATHEADAVMFPNDGDTVGVAQPLQFVFSEPVVNKEAVEQAIKITTSAGQQGSFRWYSDTLVRYRAADFWPANSTINVDMQLLGMDLGNGMIANFNKTYNVNIGNKTVMEADAGAHVVNIYVNDVLTKTFPATLGDEAFPSASGYMVLTNDKQRYATFKAASIGLKPGDPGDYGSVDVEYATRLSYSGIFIHQATPSAMPYLGAANLSHGCIGLSAEGAGWVFENMGAGDLVHTVNTPNETIAPTDGFGDWNIPYEQYASR